MGKEKAADYSRFVFLLSHERSGSHYLTSMLTGGSHLASLDEVCNFNAVNPDTAEASFLRFRRDRQIEEPDFALRPNAEAMTRLMDMYLAHLGNLVPPKKKIWLDIKYGHVHNFEIAWWPSERRPFLPIYLEQRKIRVVHLMRRDTLAATVSAFIAEKTAVWHTHESSEERTTPRMPVPVIRTVHEALALEREKDNFFTWLANNECFPVEYEQLSGSEAAREDVMTNLCTFLGLPRPEQFTSSHRKVTPPLRDAVENYDELIRVARLFGGGRLRFSNE